MISKLKFIILFISFQGYGQIFINEYSCSNSNGPTDSFGERNDWIELFNPTINAFDISGYFLSDKSSNLTKWEIPNAVIPSFGHLIIQCSGRDGVFNGEIHAGFGLTQTKNEWIILTAPSGNLVDSLKILKPTQNNHSYGRTNDGNPNWSVFINPTYGTTNTNAFSYYAPKPIFNLDGGFYNANQAIALSTSQPNTSIYYTLDGSTPSSASSLYNSPINISSSTVLRAITYSTDPQVPPSFIETNTYFINTSHVLPILSICGDEILPFIQDTHPFAFYDNFDGAIEYYGNNQQLIAEGSGAYNKHGNDSWAYGQRGFDFIMRDQYGYNYAIQDQIFKNKSRDEYKRIIVKAAANDNVSFENGAHIRDAYVHTLSQLGKLRMDERSNQSCIVYVNGQYWGIYEIREKVDDLDFTAYYYDQKDIDFIKTWGGTWAEYGNMNHWNAVSSYILNNDMSVASNYDSVKAMYNVGSLIDYVVLNAYTVCSDWLNWNTAWWHGHNTNGDKKKFRYALWDMDATFGHYINYTGIPNTNANADPCDPESLAGTSSDPQGHIAILNKLMDNEVFEQAYISRFIDLANGPLSCATMIAVLDSMVNVIRPEMQGQVNRWGGSLNQWETNVQTMKNFINNRCNALSNGLISCYNLTGPYRIVVDVQPVMAGKVKLNSSWIPYYTWEGTFYGNIKTYLEAAAFQGYEFDHWEAKTHILNQPNSITDTLSIVADDTLIAVFKEVPIIIEPTDSIQVDNKNFEGFHLPNGFSPNEDGKNDLLEFFVGNDVLNFELLIFDRWGELMFQTKSENEFWDGTFQTQKVNVGIYAYALTYTLKTGQSVNKTGNITLLR